MRRGRSLPHHILTFSCSAWRTGEAESLNHVKTLPHLLQPIQHLPRKRVCGLPWPSRPPIPPQLLCATASISPTVSLPSCCPTACRWAWPLWLWMCTSTLRPQASRWTQGWSMNCLHPLLATVNNKSVWQTLKSWF